MGAESSIFWSTQPDDSLKSWVKNWPCAGSKWLRAVIERKSSRKESFCRKLKVDGPGKIPSIHARWSALMRGERKANGPEWTISGCMCQKSSPPRVKLIPNAVGRDFKVGA